MVASSAELVELATIVGGFAAAVGAFVAVVAAPVALFQLRQAERLRRLDFYQGLLMDLYAPGATQEIAYGALGATVDATATQLRGEANKLIKASIVLRALRRLSVSDYDELFETIESDVRGTIQAMADFSARVMSDLAVSNATESPALRTRFELVNVMSQQALLILGPERQKAVAR